jgi:hypothetical protein
MTGHHPKADRLPKELRGLLPQGLAANRRGEIDRKHFPREALDLCFELLYEIVMDVTVRDAGTTPAAANSARAWKFWQDEVVRRG